ncbi:hypothetical protein ACHAXN_003195 [Cyclotella atomus]
MPKGIYPRNIPTPPTYSWQRHLPELIESIPTEGDAISYLVRHGILHSPKDFTCNCCGYVGCRLKGKKNLKGLKCNRGSCGKSLSLIKDTIFAGTKTPIHQVLYIASFFLSLAPPSDVVSQLHCSSNTVSHWYSKLRKWISHCNQIHVGEVAKKEHLSKRMRKKDVLEHGTVAVWRERNIEHLWDAFLDVIKCRGIDVAAALNENVFGDQAANDYSNMQHDRMPPALPPAHDFELDPNGMHLDTLGSEMLNGGAIESTQEWNGLSVQEPHQSHLQPSQSTKRSYQYETHQAHSTLEEGQHHEQTNDDRAFSQTAQSNNSQYSPTKKRAKTTRSIPSFLDVCRLVPTEEKAVEYLISRKIFTSPKDTICIHCGYTGFRRKEKQNPKSLKCNRCSKSQSIAKDTFFQNCKASYRTILQLAAHWLHKTPRIETMQQLKCSSATLTEFHRNFRKLIEKTMDDELRVMALTADKNAMAPEIPKGARKDELEEHYCVVLWREVNWENLWDAFIVALCDYYPDAGESDGKVDSTEVWVDAEKGTACCKYNAKMNLKEAAFSATV